MVYSVLMDNTLKFVDSRLRMSEPGKKMFRDRDVQGMNRNGLCCAIKCIMKNPGHVLIADR